MTAAPRKAADRIAHLDGLRGLAVALVVLGHVVRKTADDDAPFVRWFAPVFDADLGVLIFFVLSGFLITSILAREHERSGAINLRDFYVRRTLRIWPALYVFMGIVALVSAFSGVVDLELKPTIAAALFLQPYGPSDPAGGWWFGHTWSLSVEFLFYALWPLVLVRLDKRVALKVALAVIVVEPFTRLAQDFAGLGPENRIPNYFHTRADALMVGAALALAPLVYPDLFERAGEFVGRLRLEIFALAGLATSAYLARWLGDRYEFAAGYTFEALCVGVVIVAASREGRVRSLLTLRPLVALGVISYSVYLWQQFFLAPNWSGTTMAGVPLAVFLTLVVGALGYRYIELPFLQLKKRFEGAGESALRVSARTPAAS